ncbi:uncharacterized protein EKO05_0002109 [Ascochyta rabiei]|uniref:uncharacterized protein n=1 Tax=Didymella rabiei TaxID=5454 RepID=UPI0021FC1B34|nr:uncharacterized protein EKO05_0002109 [Ascochyta rabiei]UPX11504.1 hypothetical protein EKO05_0002109 [Ascochyta rabiei]
MPSDKVDQKPSLSRSGLQNNGIQFIEKVHQLEELEDWLQPISYQLTRKRTQPPKEARKVFKRELKEFRDSGQDHDEASEGDWSLQPGKTNEGLVCPAQKFEVETCQQAAEKVRRWRKRNENEPKWTQFFRRYIFEDFSDVQGDVDFHRETIYGWELHEDVLWNEFPQWVQSDLEVQRPTRPKPDLTYGFKIIETATELYSDYKHDRHVESFSLPWLSELRSRKKGSVISSPTTKLHQAAKSKRVTLSAKDLMCFPWAIVEVKHGIERPNTSDGHMRQNKTKESKHEKRKQFCYCQAANASAAGLVLREELAIVAEDKSESHDALVMFSFTCVGPTVKLWITYREKPSEHTSKRERSQKSKHAQRRGRIIMVCIWATSLELTWGVMALRMIVENMQEWVYARVKPEISRWIRIVHEHPPQTISLTPNGDTVVQRRRAASCEPLSERMDFKRWDLPALGERHSTPRAKAMPLLPRGKTAPGSIDRWKVKSDVPRIQLNGFIEANTGDTSDSAVEGCSSVHASGCESEEDDQEKLSGFIYDDEPSEDDKSDASYVPSSSEDDSTESENAEEEELELRIDDYDTESGEASSENGDVEDVEEYDQSDKERSQHWLSPTSSAVSNLDVYYTPTKNVRWRDRSQDRSQRGQGPSQRSRRYSSRF